MATHASAPPGRAPAGPGFWWRALSPVGAVLVAFAGAILTAGALSFTPMSSDALSAVLAFSTSSLILLLAVALWRALPVHERRAAVAVKGSPLRVIRSGILGGASIVVVAAAILAFGSAVDPVVRRRLTDYETIGTAPWQIALTVTALVVVAPLGEELLFRGLLLRALARRLRFWPAALVGAVLFASAHVDSYVLWPRAVALVVTGLILAWIYRRRGYWGSVAAHATVNAVAATALVVSSTS